jgi:hypothetical protein
MAVMVAGLSLLGAEELAPIFKESKVFKKYGPKKLIELLKKSKTGKLTKLESEELTEFGKDWAKQSRFLEKNIGKRIIKNFSDTLITKSPKFIINTLYFLKKIFPTKLAKLVFKIGGVTYTLDQLYLFVFRDILPNQKNLDKQTTNEIRNLIRKLTGHEKEVTQDLLEVATRTFKESVEGTEITPMKEQDLQTISDDVNQKNFNNAVSSLKTIKSNPTKIVKAQAPTIDDVLNNKKVIKFGMVGDSVKEIQQALYTLGYGKNLTKDGKTFDGDYGKLTKQAVESYQIEKEGLSKDGAVGKNTLNSIIDDLNSEDKYLSDEID